MRNRQAQEQPKRGGFWSGLGGAIFGGIAAGVTGWVGSIVRGIKIGVEFGAPLEKYGMAGGAALGMVGGFLFGMFIAGPVSLLYGIYKGARVGYNQGLGEGVSAAFNGVLGGLGLQKETDSAQAAAQQQAPQPEVKSRDASPVQAQSDTAHVQQRLQASPQSPSSQAQPEQERGLDYWRNRNKKRPANYTEIKQDQLTAPAPHPVIKAAREIPTHNLPPLPLGARAASLSELDEKDKQEPKSDSPTRRPR